MIKLKDILESSPTGKVRGVKGYTGFIKPSEWNSKKNSLKASVYRNTGYVFVDDGEEIKVTDDTYRTWKRPKMLKLTDILKEDINLPVNIGDTILVGKFKNKKMIVKKIGTDDHGMPTINGRKATTFRMYRDQTSHREVSIENEAFVKTGAKLKKALYYLKVPIPYITDTDKLIIFLQRNPKILIKLLTILG